MPFVWNTNPNPPARALPQAVAPEEISYKVHVVANTVNAGGTLSYNTPNIGYDVLYQLPTANVNSAHFTSAYFDNITVNTATISTASINVANITTANLVNANILYGYVGSDPTSNLGVASKHYVDAAMANVPTGGSDLQNIIDAQGDLLVGTGVHTATRLPMGTPGQILSTDSAAASGLRWVTIAGQELFYNLWVQTHYDLASNDHVVLLRSAGEIVMNDGIRTSNWINKTADIEVSGAGGLDTGSEETDRWYEVHAIRNSSTDDRALILHKCPVTEQDQAFTTTTDTSVPLRRASSPALKLSQSFIPALSGPLTSVELEVTKTGSPTGLVWLTLEADDGGSPSGTPLATSRIMDVSRLPADKGRLRYLFDTNTSVSVGTTYHLVYQSDSTLSDSNYISLWGTAAGGYANGSAKELHGSTWLNAVDLSGLSDFWFKTFVQHLPATEVTLPSGYDERCLISYVFNGSNGKFKQYVQKNRTMVMGVSAAWRAFTSVTGLIESVDLRTTVPPIPCSVQFTSWSTSGSPGRHVPIGGVECTDLPIAEGYSSGSLTSNTRGGTFESLSTVTSGIYPMLAIEQQTLLTRMQNVNCRLYTTSMLF